MNILLLLAELIWLYNLYYIINIKIFLNRRNLNKLSIKYLSYPKSSEIDAFGQKIYLCQNLTDGHR